MKNEGYTSSLVCGQCHEAIYSKWKNSMHAMSYTDPIFELGYLRALNGMGEEARTIFPNTFVAEDLRRFEFPKNP